MIESKFVRCEPDDPNRCQATCRKNQCPYKATPGSQHCPMHGGHTVAKQAEVKRKRIYNLSKWQDRISDHVNHEESKSLREEVGILRILLEGIMDRCQDQSDLLLYSNKISDLAVKIEKLVSSCNRLESATGMMLDKHAALRIASSIVSIVSSHVTDEDVLESVAQQIIVSILGTEPEPR